MTGLQALRRHSYLEEEIVFPHLPSAGLRMALMVRHREHGRRWEQLDVVEQALVQPATTGADIAAICRTLLALLERHNSQEEPVIYPHMDTVLTVEEQECISNLLGDGELPPG